MLLLVALLMSLNELHTNTSTPHKHDRNQNIQQLLVFLPLHTREIDDVLGRQTNSSDTLPSAIDEAMKCKYEVRYFSSKGAYLVLFWTQLILIVGISFADNISLIAVTPSIQTTWWGSIPYIVGFISAPLSGWLADAKYGTYRVFKFGVTTLFISLVIHCLLLISEVLTSKGNLTPQWIDWCFVFTLFLIGACACGATALPLGLDQMPDASVSNITSYIAWIVCAFYVGSFIGKVMSVVLLTCLVSEKIYSLIWALCLTISISIVLCMSFLFSPKWLIIEPKSRHSFGMIYRVLKFAAKHKAPLNRSAFTYWEEEIPSRIDLGKSKYGGPFSTEQVEDVKTILRLLAFIVVFFFNTLSLNFQIELPENNQCTIVNSVASNFYIYGFLATFLYEFLFYPFIRNRLPSILKRAGAVCLTVTIVSFACFVLRLICFLSHSSETVIAWIEVFGFYLTNGLLGQVFVTSILELICAQSPYNMRGLIMSLVGPLAFLAHFLGSISLGITKVCTSWSPVILISVKTVLCFVSFLLFCAVARWYKMRTRDENYSLQRVVEEVYDRYLTAATAHTSNYGTNQK